MDKVPSIDVRPDLWAIVRDILHRPWRVDVLDWATTSPAFRAIILRDKVVLQKAGIQASAGAGPSP